MDKKSPKGRKRTSKGDENYWDCSVCTFRNNAEAFKCSMCDVRKGTSTRRPRINADLVAAQVQQAQALTPPPSSSSTASVSKSSTPDPSEDEDSLQSLPLRTTEDTEDSSPKELPSIELPSEDEPSTSKGQSKKDRKKKLEPVPSSSSSGPPPPPAKKKYNINPAKLRNVDRSSATYHSVTVNDFTVVITEFKPKIKKEKLKKPHKKTEAPGKKSANGTTVLADGSPSTNEVNGHEETMRNNNADASDSRSS
uniref:RING1 and YY1-binding protein n=1 Tax=Lepeophtheirus salmonis TaxID=72036 RepID=C1BTU5_LEPSM|nr:RING1 and YY1-binding protein [Lepeophtheirus salmonis]